MFGAASFNSVDRIGPSRIGFFVGDFFAGGAPDGLGSVLLSSGPHGGDGQAHQGGGGQVLLGGTGDEVMIGSSGRDVLIGGFDSEWLMDGSDGAARSARPTADDVCADAVSAVLQEWGRADGDYAGDSRQEGLFFGQAAAMNEIDRLMAAEAAIGTDFLQGDV